MIRYRVSFRCDFIPFPYRVSIFDYMIPTKLQYPETVIPERVYPGSYTGAIYCSRTKSGRTFHKYYVKEVRAHSGVDFKHEEWFGLPADSCFGSADVYSRMRTYL